MSEETPCSPPFPNEITTSDRLLNFFLFVFATKLSNRLRHGQAGWKRTRTDQWLYEATERQVLKCTIKFCAWGSGFWDWDINSTPCSLACICSDRRRASSDIFFAVAKASTFSPGLTAYTIIGKACVFHIVLSYIWFTNFLGDANTMNFKAMLWNN